MKKLTVRTINVQNFVVSVQHEEMVLAEIQDHSTNNVDPWNHPTHEILHHEPTVVAHVLTQDALLSHDAEA